MPISIEGLAEASASPTLLALFDQLNMIRRMVSFGTARRVGPKPPETHPSFVEHDCAFSTRSPLVIPRRPKACHAAAPSLGLRPS
jgi:hypothetical protein